MVAPMMALVTKGRDTAKAIAICAGIKPMPPRERNIGCDRLGPFAVS